MSSFVDNSVECAICLASLDDEETPTTTLTCGHRWHTDCLRQQLQSALPNHSQRLVFSGCRCAKCGIFCQAEGLEDITRRTDTLRTVVDDLIRSQLQVDAPEFQLNPNEALEYGRRTYAFYLCAGCETPYFGGTIECADALEGERPSEDRYCPECRNTGCRRPLEHQGLQIYKCRYCCRPSSFVCYGTVHFCKECHDRNSKRDSKTRPLAPIPCAGQSCMFPKDTEFHNNGSSVDCEQIYHCAGCVSSVVANHIPPGGPNWIQNPSGESGLLHWQTPRGRVSPWKVETGEDGTFNFVSSFSTSMMSQQVHLHEYLVAPETATIEIAARFKARTDCASIFRMVATRLDKQGNSIEVRDTGVVSAPADAWERITLILSAMERTHSIAITLYGKDSNFWAGNFGSKVKDISVRVLTNDLRGVLRPSRGET